MKKIQTPTGYYCYCDVCNFSKALSYILANLVYNFSQTPDVSYI